MKTYESIQPYHSTSKQKQIINRNYIAVQPNTQALKLECNCQISTTLKLKIINVNSENQLLKKKLTQVQFELERAKKFENAFNQSIKSGRIQTLNQKQYVDRSCQSHKIQNATACKQSQASNPQQTNTIYPQNSILTQTNQILSNYLTNCQDIENKPLNDSWKLKEYQFLKKLSSAEQKQTVKSLQFSIDSRQSLHQYHQKQNKKHYDHEEMFTLREEYQQSRLYLQKMYQNKILNLEEKLEMLRIQNQEMEFKLKQNEQFITSKENYQIRETAYFPSIREEQQQQQKSDYQKDLDSANVLNNLQNKSISSENLGEISQQLRIIKITLEKTYLVLRTTSTSIKEIIDSLNYLKKIPNKMKLVPLYQYAQLLQYKKRYSIEEKKVKMFQQQNIKLKEMLKETVDIC